MAKRQQVHKLIDCLNLNGLNYIVSVLNGLSADNWIDVPLNNVPYTEQISEKQAAFKRLEARRKKYVEFDLEDIEEAKTEGILGKWGGAY
ncbi:MAG: hypothetical protein IJM54_01780 [Thermoguttaceae bacterium]|nr:hypothetical protein [Thermoguttaceae bacterium]MBR5757313.1 hypothetical protein [Thermoguttaceae bacterium]